MNVYIVQDDETGKILRVTPDGYMARDFTVRCIIDRNRCDDNLFPIIMKDTRSMTTDAFLAKYMHNAWIDSCSYDEYTVE